MKKIMTRWRKFPSRVAFQIEQLKSTGRVSEPDLASGGLSANLPLKTNAYEGNQESFRGKIMKKSQKQSLIRSAALVALSFCALMGSSFAATKPLNYPYGLAVDAKGNLYVANSNGNDVLVYSPAYTQLTGKTITKNISSPTAVVIDQIGQIWVANGTTNSITQYSSGGVQNTAITITSGVSNPYAMVLDGISNLWVQNGFTSITAYNTLFAPTQLLATYTAPSNVNFTGIGAYLGFITLGNNTDTQYGVFSDLLVYQGTPLGHLAETCFAMQFDPTGNLYCGNQDNTLSVDNFNKTAVPTTLAQLPGFPTGLAVDAKRGRVYVSFGPLNEILVYSTTGTLLHMIQ
jgi:hypothetical protein